jgi:hypothetical protein
MIFNNIHSEKGACGRYNMKGKLDAFSVFLTIFTRKNAPAAAIKTQKKHEIIHGVFNNV